MAFQALIALCIYLTGVLWVHWNYRRLHHNGTVTEHYVLITKNNQLQIEWMIRSLLLAYWIKGKSLKISVLDQNSRDETLMIVGRLSQFRNISVRSIQASEDILCSLHGMYPEGEQMIIIDANKREDLSKIPLFQ